MQFSGTFPATPPSQTLPPSPSGGGYSVYLFAPAILLTLSEPLLLIGLTLIRTTNGLLLGSSFQQPSALLGAEASCAAARVRSANTLP